MTTLYIIIIVVLIAVIISMMLQFFVVKERKEITEINSTMCDIQNLIKKKKFIVREPDCTLRHANIHIAIYDNDTVLVIDLCDDANKLN